jgi:glyceraldehyde 3-phosphate dehydrogenase
MKIGLIGVGRIGRILIKLILKENYEIVFINEINQNVENCAYLLNYDNPKHSSVKFKSKKNILIADKTRIPFFSYNSLKKINFKKYKIDFLIDTSGSNLNLNFIRKNKISFKYLISNNGDFKNDIFSIVPSMTLQNTNIERYKIFSGNICDVVALHPVIDSIYTKIKIESLSLTTLHPWLINQKLLSGSSVKSVEYDRRNFDYALGRSAINNLIPKNSSVISGLKMIKSINRNLFKNFNAMTFRVPTSVVCAGILNIEFKKKTSIRIIKDILLKYEKKQKKIIKNSFEPLISEDFKDDEYLVTIDHNFLEQISKNIIRLHYWYDNEFGYSISLLENLKSLKNYFQK